jgi:endonuclease YncB( thermonuclease family)
LRARDGSYVLIDMFFLLHRIYLVGWISLVLGGIAWLYPRTGLTEPVVDWYQVWQNTEGATRPSVEHISGNVTKVTDATSFVLRSQDRQLYSIALAGLLSPTAKAHPDPKDFELAQECRTRLADLIVSNQVEVTLLSIDPQHRGVGVVHIGKTNINARLVESGALPLKRSFIKELPLMDQYQLIRSERITKQRASVAEK